MALAHGRSLTQNVDLDLEVMDVSRVDIVKLHVEARGVAPLHTRDLTVLNTDELEQVRSTMRVLLVPLTNPPVIAEAIDHAVTSDRQVGALFKTQQRQQVLLVVLTGCARVNRPLLVVHRRLKDAIDLKSHVS